MTTQGIVVNIKAKIEGWEESLKQIQAKAKNINIGSDLGKSLTASIKQADSMINNLGKNLNQRLTSDSQINSFTDKIREIESLFNSMGQSMQSISFSDLNTEYITNNFKDLLTAIQQANDELSTGMQTSFQDAIQGSDKLQKAFSQLKINPKDMSMDELKTVLNNAASNISQQVKEANDQVDTLRNRLKDIKNENNTLNNSPIMKDSAKNLANNIMGSLGTFQDRELNRDALQSYVENMSTRLDEFGDKLKGKRPEIEEALNNLLNAASIDEMEGRVDRLRELLKGTGLFKEFQVDLSKNGMEALKSSFINDILPTEDEINARLDILRTAFASFNSKDIKLDNVIKNAKDILQNQEWDKLPDFIESIIDEVQSKIRNRMALNTQESGSIRTELEGAMRNEMQIAAQKYNVDQANTELNTIIQTQVQAAIQPYIQKIAQLEERLQGKATEDFHGFGRNLSDKSSLGYQTATAEASAYEAQLGRIKSAEQAVGKVQGVVQRWFSVYAAVRMVRNGIKNVTSTIQTLDKTMTEIAIVTDKSQSDLWQQMPQYTQMAKQYAASISGVYEVSQLYYQQGLQMNDVMSLTEATLKMARISGLDYSEATDYMTNAIRSFKMEMSDAEHVVDVYSAVAASSATNVTELATAMSKTASSAQAVGSSFENTTAMMAVMIEATRESPENIGSAMKSIISRYGELKENKTGIDEEGEEYSLNKVDTALQTVGISVHDAKGEFRDFDEVIMELADKWDTIDKNTQRYIATVMAGNRQQSRFLALVSSSERLKEESAKAADSEDASQLQFLKSLDSVDSKLQQLQTSIQSMYTGSGLEDAYKGLLDFSNAIVTSFANLSGDLGLGAALSKIGATFTTTATLATTAFTSIKTKFSTMQAEMTAKAQLEGAKRVQTDLQNADTTKLTEEELKLHHQRVEEANTEVTRRETELQTLEKQKSLSKHTKIGMIASAAGMAVSTYAASLDVNKDRQQKAWTTLGGGVLSGIGTGAMVGGIPGAILGALTALPSIIEGIGMFSESATERVNRLKKEVEDASNKELESKSDLKTLTDYKKKYDELSKAQHQSAEKQKEFKDLQNEIAEKYPSLIKSMDSEGNALIDMADSYDKLREAKQGLYEESFSKSLATELSALKDINYVLSSIYGITPGKNKTNIIGQNLNTAEKYPSYFQQSLLDNRYKAGEIPKQAVTENDRTSIIWGDEGFAQLVADMSTNLADLFGLDKGLTANNIGYAGSFYQSPVVQAVFAQMYGQYKQNILDEKAYGEISFNIEALLDKAISEAGSNLEKGGPGYEELKTNLSKAKISEDTYKLWEATKSATDFSTKLQKNLISSKNSQLINTLDDSVSSVLDFDTTKLQKYAIKRDLDQGLIKFLKDNADVIGNGAYEYWDEEEGKAKQYDEEHLIEAYYSGGVRQRGGKDLADEVKRQSQTVNETWYKEQLDNYSYLNKSLDTLYDNLGKSTRANIRDEVNQLALSKREKRHVTRILQDAFDELYSNTLERYDNWTKSLTKDSNLNEETIKKLKNFRNIFGPEYLQGIQDQYKDILKNENLTPEQQEKQLGAINDLLTGIAGLGEDAKDLAISKFQTADLTSLNGIYSFIQELTSANVDIDASGINQALITLTDLIPKNLISSFSTFSDELVASSEDFDKKLSKASKGMDLKEASEMANELGIDLQDFTFKNGQYFYDVADAPKKIQEGYLKFNQNLKDRLDLEYDALTKDSTINQERGLIQKQFQPGTTAFDAMISQSQLGEKWGKMDKLTDRIDKLKSVGMGQIYSDTELTELINLYDQYYDTWKSQKDDVDGEKDFNQYVLKELETAHTNMTTVLDDYSNYQLNAALLEMGYIGDFLEKTGAKKTAGDFYLGGNTLQDAQAEAEAYNQDLVQRIAQGNIENLPEELKPFTELIVKTYKDITTSTTNALFDAAEGGAQQIAITDSNREFLKTLKEQGFVSGDLEKGGDEYAKILSEAFISDESKFNQYLNGLDLTRKERVDWLKKWHDIKYPKTVSTVSNMITEGDTVTYDNFVEFIKATEGINADINDYLTTYGLTEDGFGGFRISDYDQYIAGLENQLKTMSGQGLEQTEEYKSTLVSLDAAKRTHKNKEVVSQMKAFQDIISNYSNISDDQITALQESLSAEDWEEIDDYIVPLGTGESRLKIGELKESLSKLDISDKVREAILGMFDSITDDYLKNFTTAASLVSQGTTNQADIQKFITSAKQLGIDAEDAFSYDSLLNSWTLNTATMIEYVQAQAQQLVKDKLLTPEDVTDYVNKNVSQALANQVDIKAFLDAENKQGQARQKLSQQLLKAGLINKDTQQQLTEAEVESMISTIEQGGIAAVEIMNNIAKAAGKELTSAEIESAYRAQVSQIEAASEQLSLSVGSLVTGESIKMLENAGYELQRMGDGNTAVINQIGSISKAYANYYQTLKDSNEATLEALNNAMGKVLETKEGRASEAQAISALSEASGMTYSTLASIFTEAGIELTEEMVDQMQSANIIEDIGGGKTRIKNFSAFAHKMGWQTGSEEYLNAFSSFNDGLVELSRKNKTQSMDELNKLKEARPGDLLNLTHLSNQIQKYSEGQHPEYAFQDFYKNLQFSIAKFGGVFTDGILELTDGANLLGIAQTLAEAAETSGSEMTAQLQDMVQSIMQSYTDAITKGIEGGMTNEEMQDLIKKGSDLGIEIAPSDFMQMENGLQLSSDAAISLYTAMSKVDKLQGQVLFKTLSKNLKETNKNYKSTSALITHIAEMQNKYNKLKDKEKKGTEEQIKNTKKQIKQLEEELKLAREISQTDFNDKDIDWNFMNRDALPGDLQNAMEYWQGWDQALKNIDTWAQQGYAGVDSFLTLIQHAEEVANGTTGSLEMFGTTIGKYGKFSYESIRDLLPSVMEINQKTGEWQINLKKLAQEGIKVGKNATSLGKDARSQIKGYVKDIEALNDAYDTFFDGMAEVEDMLNDEDGGLNFDDFLDDNGAFDYSKFEGKLKKRAGALKYWNEFLGQMKFNGKEWKNIKDDMGKGGEGYKAMQSVIKMALMGELGDGTDSEVIADALSRSGFEGEFQLADSIYHVKKGKVIIEYKDSNGNSHFTTPDGQDLGTDSKEAMSKLLQLQLDSLTKEWDKYGKSGEVGDNTTIEVAGKTYKIRVEDDHYVIEDENGNPIASADNLPQAEQTIKDQNESTKQMSDEAYKLKRNRETSGREPTSVNAYGKEKTGAIGEKSRNWMRDNGIETGADLQQAFNNYMDNLPEGMKYEDGLLEFEVESGLKLTKKDGEDGVEVDWDNLADQGKLTQTAADVAAGVTAAFANTNIGATITQAINDSFTGGEDGKINVEIAAEADEGSISAAQSKLDTLKVDTITVKVDPPNVSPVLKALEQIPRSISVTVTPTMGGIAGRLLALMGFGRAKGTITPTGAAHAQSTLMGELGPEMVVSNGRYFVVGQNGPEFVDLNQDAIVFNHLQTRSLLEKGTSNTRGRAITNERKAVAYAHGNISGGPAHVWDTRRKTHDTDKLGDAALDPNGSGNGAAEAIEGLIKALDKWYNLLQEISKIQTKINKEEALRAKIQSDLNKSGKEYYESQKRSIEQLKKEVETSQQLVDEQRAERDKRTKELKKAPFGKMYETDEDGQVKMKTSFKKEYDKYFGDTDTGKPKKTIKQQYDWLKKQFGAKALAYDSNGKQIEFTGDDKNDKAAMKTAVEAALKRMEAQKDEVQGLTDSINEHEKAILEAQEKENELLQAMRDNQISVEDSVLEAIVDMREREIEDQEELRNAIEESTNKFIDGLSNALDQERKMYEMEDKESDLRSKQRQLAVLQRTGGSGSEIASLESEIESAQRDLYFDKQQEQIDAIKEASDKELERMDMEIDIMKEQLEYEKEHGLLWDQVYEVMKEDAATIADFVINNNSEWWSTSAIATQKGLADAIFEAEQWKAYVNDTGDEEGGEKTEEDKETTKKKKKKKKKEKDKSSSDDKKTIKSQKWVSDGVSGHHYQTTYSDGTVSNGSKQSHTLSNGKCTKCGAIVNTTTITPSDKVKGPASTTSVVVPQKKLSDILTTPLTTTRSIPKKAKGGYTNHGIYELGEEGTEAIFTAEQTSILRNKILANKPNSLINLLADFQEIASKMANGSTYNSIDRSAATSIGSMAVNMNVKEIANDYDAKRAGEQAMEEMLRIARKSTVTSLRR